MHTPRAASLSRALVLPLAVALAAPAAGACGQKYEPEPIGPYDFCITTIDCPAGMTCLQNLCTDPATTFTESCAVTTPTCASLPSDTVDLATGVDLLEGSAALQGNRLLVISAILGVDLSAHQFDVSSPASPAALLEDVSVVGARAAPDRPRTVCTGFGYGMVWTDGILGERSVWFGRLSNEGVPVTTDVLVARRGREADLVFTGGEVGDFGITWTNPAGSPEPGVWFTRVDGVGFLLEDDPIRVAERTTEGSAYPAIAHDGQDTYGIAWNEGDQVRFALVSTSGAVIFDDEVGRGATGVRAVQVVFDGVGWGVMWRGSAGPTIRTLMANGIPAGPETDIGTFLGDVDEHRLGWFGDRYWGAWADPTLSPGSITLTSVDRNGVVLDSTTVNGGGISASPPHLFGADELAGVVFSVRVRPDEPDPDDLVYATVTCN